MLYAGRIHGVVFLLFAGVSLVRAAIRKLSTELVITNRRVMVKPGLIGRRTFELHHEKVEGFRVHQGVLGRILGFGSVIVCGAGGGRLQVPKVADPLGFRRKAMRLADDRGRAAAGS